MAAPPFDALYGLEIEAATGRGGARRGARHATACASPPGSCTAGSTRRWPSRSRSPPPRPRTGRGRGRPLEPDELPAPDHRGTVHAAGRPRHAGRSTWVWEFDVTDDDERLCALGPHDRRAPRRVANVNGGWVREVEGPAYPAPIAAERRVVRACAVNNCPLEQPPHAPPPARAPAVAHATAPPPRRFLGACTKAAGAPSPTRGSVRDRHPPVAPERPRRDLDARAAPGGACTPRGPRARAPGRPPPRAGRPRSAARGRRPPRRRPRGSRSSVS